MCSFINLSALIGLVTNEHQFYERYETSCDMSQEIKRYESFYTFQFKHI